MPLFGYSLDDLLSYSTVKLVRLRDKRLGLLHYTIMLLIFAYIVGYDLLYLKVRERRC